MPTPQSRKTLPRTKKEHTFFFIALCIVFTLFSGFLPNSETAVSKNIRKTLYTSSQTFFGTFLSKKNETPQDFMVMQVSIGQQKIVITPTLPPVQTVAATWGKATQIDEHTWTMKIQSDIRMATAEEILAALNTYRQGKGRGSLSWDDKLASYAQERAAFFVSNGKLDGHAGFQDYMNNDGFGKLGFSSLGENSSYGYLLEGVHLIEWVYAGDAPHDNNQLNSEWSHVGIGVNGTATDLIFGGRKR
jgi:uncharacterized protein YkwD